MTTELTVDARPTKKFFIENITRDLSLEDAILDLVDNSIDSLIRTRNLDVSPSLLRSSRSSTRNTLVSAHLSKDRFTIEDKCGGIDLAHARDTVFRLGRPDGSYPSTLGVYGIGLKRALFKIGKSIEVTSKTKESGFRVVIDVPTWAADDDDWTFPLYEIPAAKTADQVGTTISIKQLNSEVLLRLGDGTLIKRLANAIASTYSLFLDRFLGIGLNGKEITALGLPLASSSELKPNSRHLSFNGVSVDLVAGMAARTSEDIWTAERAGWYVLCNGRVVVQADKTELTGWGISGPTFVSKYRGFLGIAFFYSDRPEELPWTTTKRGLNRDSRSYINARKEMAALARPVLTFLNDMYEDPDESRVAREMTRDLKPATLSVVVSSQRQDFGKSLHRRTKKATTVSVQFEAKKADVDCVRRQIGKPSLSAGAVGRFAFEQYVKAECPE